MSDKQIVAKKASSLLEQKRQEIIKMVPQWVDPDRFMLTAVMAVSKNPDLQLCTPDSFILSVLEAARTGLMVDGKEAAIIRYKNRAELMPMVQGLIRLILRSPGVTKVEARAVYSGDFFGYEYGLTPRLEHRPGPRHDGEIVTHAYAIVWRQGAEPTFEVVTREEIELARLTSRAPDSPAWKNWYGEMARKVALKRLAKYVDLSPEASRAIELDHFITGDPSMDTAIGAVSDEYENEITKARTKERIEHLKQVLDEGKTEAEHEPEPILPEAPDLPDMVPETPIDDPYARLGLRDDKRPYLPHIVAEKLKKLSASKELANAKPDDRRGKNMTLLSFVVWQVRMCLEGYDDSDAMRIAAFRYVWPEISSFSELTGPQLAAIERMLGSREKDGPGAGYFPLDVAVKEVLGLCQAAIDEGLIEPDAETEKEMKDEDTAEQD